MEWAASCPDILNPEETFLEEEPKDGDTALVYASRLMFPKY